MIIAQIKRKDLVAESLSVDDLEREYVDYNAQMEKNKELRQEAKHWFSRLESGDSEAKSIWDIVRRTSIQEFDKVYEQLGVEIDNAHGESFYAAGADAQARVQKIIDLARLKKLSKKSDSAEIIEFSDLIPAILIKSDGTTTYFTRDLAAISYRVEQFSPQKIIYEVGSDQILHFRQVFKAAEMLGISKGVELVHIAHGLIRFPEGKSSSARKMSTRAGKTVKLSSVLEESMDRSLQLINESEALESISEGKKMELAKQIGIGAVKYYDLLHNPKSDILFDWEQLFLLEGNSSPYLQYTNARAGKVLQKSGVDVAELTQGMSDYSYSDQERNLMRSLMHFDETLENVQQNYSPNLLTNYLYSLAKDFNSFYSSSRIIGDDNESLRLLVTYSVAQVIQNGLTLLGIDSPERM